MDIRHQATGNIQQDDFADNTTTTGRLEVGGASIGTINAPESDWFQMSIDNAGLHEFSIEHLTLGASSITTLRDSSGNWVAGGAWDVRSFEYTFSSDEIGIYYLEAHSGTSSGDYLVHSINLTPVDDYSSDTNTSGY